MSDMLMFMYEENLGFPPGTVLRDATTDETLAQRETRRLAELDAETLRYVGADQRVAKHYSAAPFVLPLEAVGHIVCPRHGVCDIPDPDAAMEKLRVFIGDTAPGSKRRYLMFRGSSVT